MVTEDGIRYRIRHERRTDRTGQVLQKGGRTVCEILAETEIDEDGGPRVLVAASARCRKDEPFDKRLGRTIALGRALKTLQLLAEA